MVREMQFSKVLIFPLLILGVSCQGMAREVERLQFEHPDGSERDGLRRAGQAELGWFGHVSQSLLEQFQFAAAGRTSSTDLAHRPMTSRQSCNTDTYRPTWWLSRATETRRASYHSIVAGIACQYGIPARLLDAVIAQESGFASGSISSAGAMGMMQLMPGTARSLGLSNPFDPIANMHAGARYLRQQFERFGRVDLALAAYNAGPERRSLRLGRIPAIPETQHYVRTILTNWGRLIELDQANVREPDRGELAMLAVRASGYRDVELIRYDGLNASNPM